jgi:hypothetical protein
MGRHAGQHVFYQGCPLSPCLAAMPHCAGDWPKARHARLVRPGVPQRAKLQVRCRQGLLHPAGKGGLCSAFI